MKKYAYLIGILGIVLIVAGLVIYSINSLMTTLSTVLLVAGIVFILAYTVVQFQKIKMALSSRSVKFGSNAVLMTLIILGILILVNFVSGRHSFRADTTAAKQFSLADQTKKILKSLKKEVRVTSFFKTGEQYQMEELLKEYSHYAGRLKYELIDPDKRPAVAKQYGIKAYGTTVVESAGKEENITGTTEQDLTNAVIKVTREGVKKICFTTGHGERSIENSEGEGLSDAKKSIQNENYQVEEILLAEKQQVPEDCSVLVISGPQSEFLPNEADMVNAFLNKGGKAFFMLDPAPGAGYADFLKKWGFNVGDNTVVDASGIGALFGAGPAMPIVSQYERHAITDGFRVMTFYSFVRSVAPADNPPSGITVQSLGETSPRSWGETQIVSGTVRYDEGKDLKGPISIAAVAEKEISATPKEGEDISQAKKLKTRIVVFGDSDFASNAFFKVQGNGNLFMNALSWLAEEEDLISVRPHDPEDRRVNLTQRQSRMILYFGVILLPLVVLGAGIGEYVRRR